MLAQKKYTKIGVTLERRVLFLGGLDRRAIGHRETMFSQHSRGGAPARARLLVVDDHALMRVAIDAILARDDTLEVVGEAQDGQEAIARCKSCTRI